MPDGFTDGGTLVGLGGVVASSGVTEDGTDPTVALMPLHTNLRMGNDGSYYVSNGSGPLPNRSKVPYEVTPISAEEYERFSEGLNGNPRVRLEEMYKLLAEPDGFKLIYVRNSARLLIPPHYASMPVARQTL